MISVSDFVGASAGILLVDQYVILLVHQLMRKLMYLGALEGSLVGFLVGQDVGTLLGVS